MPDAKKKRTYTKRANAVRATHVKKTKDRAAEAQSVKAQYLAQKDDPILIDILAKAKSFISYHNKIAQDGVGSKVVGQNDRGEPKYDTVFLSNNQRAGHLDKSAGIQELVDYIERQTTLPVEATV